MITTHSLHSLSLSLFLIIKEKAKESKSRLFSVFEQKCKEDMIKLRGQYEFLQTYVRQLNK